MMSKCIKTIVLLTGMLWATSVMAAPPSILLFDNFNCENEGAPACTYADFKNWTVDAGTVDLVGDTAFPDNVLFLGFGVECNTTPPITPSTLTSKTEFTLTSGSTYILSFDARASSADAPAEVQVTLGNALVPPFVVEDAASFQGFSRSFHVDGDVTGPLSFEVVVDGGGLFLDNVALIAAPDDCESCVLAGATATPNQLWPPNHKMVPVTVRVTQSGECDQGLSCKITEVRSNELENGLGDGDTAPDWLITGDLSVNLRAERSGPGSGRVYTLTLTCTDASGNESTGTVNVTVPHDQGRSGRGR